MQKQSIPLKVKQLKIMYERGTLEFNNPIQRRADIWDIYKKSMLIDSILEDYIIPPMYFIKEDKGSKDSRGRDISNYDVIDGKQRLLNVFDFIDGKYALHQATPTIETDEWEIELAGKKFDELEDDLQENINNFCFQIYNLEGNSDEEIEEFFLRINGGTSLSKNQITKGKLGIGTAKYLNPYLDGKFMGTACNFSGTQYKTEVDLCTLLQCLMMLDVNAGNYEFTSFSESDVQDYAATLHDEINPKTKEHFEDIMIYLDRAFSVDKKEKWLRKTHVPMVFLVADFALYDCNDVITPEQFYEWYTQFAANYTPDCEYAKYCGAGSVKKAKVYGRIDTMLDDFRGYIAKIYKAQDEAQEENTQDNTEETVAENETVEPESAAESATPEVEETEQES